MSSYQTEHVVIVTQHMPECGWPGPCGCTMAIIPQEKPCWARQRSYRMPCDLPRGHTGSHGLTTGSGLRVWWDSDIWRIQGPRIIWPPFNDPVIVYRRVGPPGGVNLLRVLDFSRRT